MPTDAKVRAAKGRDKPYKITDGRRLYLLVTPNRSKLWRWNYTYNGKQKTMAFGAYPILSLDNARAERDQGLVLLRDGHDPAISRKLRIAENRDAARWTFERVARAWHENFKSQWAVRHGADIMRSLERDVFPKIGNLPIAQLAPPLLLTVLRAIEAQGSIETSKRTRQRISAVFVFGIAEGVAHSDPAERLGAALKPLRKGRQPAITDLGRFRR